MYTKFLLLADSAHVDSDGKLHVQGIFEHIKSFKFPCFHQKMTIVTQIESTDKNIGPFFPTIQLKDESGKIIFSFSMPSFKFKVVPKKGTVVRHTLFINLQNTQFNVPGPYTIVLLIDNKYLDSAEFNVLKIPVMRSGARA